MFPADFISGLAVQRKSLSSLLNVQNQLKYIFNVHKVCFVVRGGITIQNQAVQAEVLAMVRALCSLCKTLHSDSQCLSPSRSAGQASRSNAGGNNRSECHLAESRNTHWQDWLFKATETEIRS